MLLEALANQVEPDLSDAKRAASGLYRLPQDATRAGTDGAVAVATPAEQWAFALEMPAHIADGMASERFRVKLAARVLSGRVGVGVLTKDRARFQHYEMTSPAETDTWQVLELGTPPAADCGPLVVNNASAEGSSRAEVRILEISKLLPLARPAAASIREVHVIEDMIAGNLQHLYLDKAVNWLRPNLTCVTPDGTIIFETNEIGLKGDPIDPSRNLAVVWGDSVVFGIGRSWPCLLDDMLPGYQFLNGGIEGNSYELVLHRAVTLNRERHIGLNVMMLGWHPHGRNERVRTDLIAALDDINNPVLVTMPTVLNRKIVNDDLSNYLEAGGDANTCFLFYGAEKYSIEMQQEIFRHITERNRITREVAAAKGVPLLDLFATFATDQLADFRQDFFDVMHPRPNAYEKIARAICDGLGIIPET